MTPASPIAVQAAPSRTLLADIERLDRELLRRYADRFAVQPTLTRSLVSFQANKSRATYRWFKYKEAFSAALVESLLARYHVRAGKMLDPFAGSGTALFVASDAGLDADGIELLPIGQELIATRKLLDANFSTADVATLERWARSRPWEEEAGRSPLPELRITQGAYPEPTRKAIEQYMAAWGRENVQVQAVLRLALLCVLEAISYTRKDGQYLRWDHRSARRQGQRPFNKGSIPTFDQAICAKLVEIVSDLQPHSAQLDLFPSNEARGKISLYGASSLDVMVTLPNNRYSAIVTSPPYCNRYDYTRTYALELALLGVSESELVNLRQQMLSCTVENRSKDLLSINPAWSAAIAATDAQELLQAILQYLHAQKSEGLLNNTGIPRMVKGYFYEMACILQECARVMNAGTPLIMVNDNVRYAGISISVDAILSDIAEKLGFCIENILVLPGDKGNSSQQMGEHGRDPLRKCIYIWRKK